MSWEDEIDLDEIVHEANHEGRVSDRMSVGRDSDVTQDWQSRTDGERKDVEVESWREDKLPTRETVGLVLDDMECHDCTSIWEEAVVK